MYARQPNKVAHLRSWAFVALLTSTRKWFVAKQMAHGAVELILNMCVASGVKKIYVPERSIMYVTVSACFQIRFAFRGFYILASA